MQEGSSFGMQAMPLEKSGILCNFTTILDAEITDHLKWQNLKKVSKPKMNASQQQT